MKNTIEITLRIPVTEKVKTIHEDAEFRFDSYYTEELKAALEDKLVQYMARLVQEVENSVSESMYADVE